MNERERLEQSLELTNVLEQAGYDFDVCPQEDENQKFLNEMYQRLRAAVYEITSPLKAPEDKLEEDIEDIRQIIQVIEDCLTAEVKTDEF